MIAAQVDELDVVLESANPFEVSNEINRTVDHDAMVLSEVIRAAALDIVEEEEEGEEREEGAVGEAEGTEGEDGTEWVDGQKEGEEQETTDRRKKIVGEYDLERMEQKGCCEEDVPNKKLEDMNDDDDNDDDDDEMWDRSVLQRVSIGFREVSSVRTDVLETSLEGTALVEQELVEKSDERSKITSDESVSSTEEDDDVIFMNQLIKKFGMEDVRGNTLCSWL